PGGPAPEAIVEASASLGGWEGLASIMRSVAGMKPTPIASYRCKFSLPTRQWSCSLVPRVAGSAPEEAVLGSLAENLTLEGVKYRLEDGASGLDQLQIAEDASHFRVTVWGRSVLKVQSDLEFPYAQELNELVVENLFSRKTAKPQPDSE